ncbi:MAG: sulfate adenylyltransferase subunit CysN [Acidobacteriota bacterium]|nr:sulfate adenylyltransferase subunit CysN [Acidobacteriota bacterium]
MTSLTEKLKEEERKGFLRFSTAGSVDDGKSTLIGRLLHDSKNVYEDHFKAISKDRRADEQPDWALLTDGLKAEREQGITIDVAYRYFATAKRKYIIADTPGHEQYTRNMATGASTADLTIILIDARNGVLPQSRRHAFIASLLQIPHIIVAVNKMDLMDYSEEVFNSIRDEFGDFAARLQVSDIRFMPISALMGDNVVERSERMPWYNGESLLEILDNIYIDSDRNLVDLRFPVQSVLRPDQNFRGFSGQIASGVMRKGDELMALPSMKTSKVASIVTFDGELDEAFPPQSVTVTLEDEIDISRGDMLVHVHNRPRIERQFEAMVVWMDEDQLDVDETYYIKHTTQTTQAMISELRYRVDINTLSKEDADTLVVNEIGRIVFLSHQPLKYDAYEKNRATGSIIMIHPVTNRTVGAGMIIEREPSEALPARMEHGEGAVTHRDRKGKVELTERMERMKQRPVTIWFTGLVSVGKRSVAQELERRLFDRKAHGVMLDGGALREGLSRDLGFATADIAEHLRRMAETARLLNDHGQIAVCSVVSPEAGLRRQARDIIGKERYIEVFLDAPLEWCEEQDETGLYAKARKGDIKNLAGVNMPYERPEHSDLTLRMDQVDVNTAVEQILDLLETRNIFHN